MRNGRVEHIHIERLGDGYSKTLCGRIVETRYSHFDLYPCEGYFRDNSPDCQDCLHKHFDKRKRPVRSQHGEN